MPSCGQYNIAYPINPCVSLPAIYVLVDFLVVSGKLNLRVKLNTFGAGNIYALNMQVSYGQQALAYPLGQPQTGTLIPDTGSVPINVPAQGSGEYTTMFPLNPNPNTATRNRYFYKGVVNITDPCPQRSEFQANAIPFP